jgi:hypothetical protein
MEKRYKKKKPMLLIIIIVAAAIFAVVAVANYKPATPSRKPGEIYYAEDFNNSIVPSGLFDQDIVAKAYLNPTFNPITQDYRPRWEGCTDEQYKQIFGNLPKMPQDFYKRFKLFIDGLFTDYERLGPEYWKQPEFYGLDEYMFKTYLREDLVNMWYIGQIACTPSIRNLEIKAGNTVNLSTFFHTGVTGSEAYLGAIIRPIYPKSAMNQEGQSIYDNPENIEDYIKVRITSPSNDPLYSSEEFQSHMKGKITNLKDDYRLLLFPATYRSIDVGGEKVMQGFKSNWCYKITFEVNVLPGTPVGNYVIAIDAMNPSDAIAEEYNWEISGSPYYSYYLPAIREQRPVAPYFQLIISVL